MPATSSLALLGRVVLFSILVAIVGCSKSDRIAVHPVEGQLSWKGQPLANAFVVLHPRDSSDARLLPARGQTDAAGKFQITTFEQADGAAAGEYRVTVEYYRPVKTDAGFGPGPNVLPPKFARPDSSNIIVQVAAGKNTLEPISLR